MTDEKWILLENGVDTKNGKSNPFGWSICDLYFYDHMIGILYCGSPETDLDYIKFEVVKENNNTDRLNIYMKESKFNELTKELAWEEKLNAK